MGLLDDDREYIDAVIEASHWGSAYYLRRLFVTLVMSNQFSRLEEVWNNTWEYLSDDILFKQRTMFQVEGK